MLFSYVYLTAEVKRMQCDMGVVNMVAAPPMLNVFDGFPPFSLQSVVAMLFWRMFQNVHYSGKLLNLAKIAV